MMFRSKLIKIVQKKWKFSIPFFIFLSLAALLYFSVPSDSCRLDHDANGYKLLAVNFAKTWGFAESGKPLTGGHTLGYPFVLGLVFKLFGFSYSNIVIFHIILCFLSMFLIYLICSRFFNKMVGLIALYITSVSSLFLVYSQAVMSEVILAFCLIFFVERLTYFFIKQNFSALIVSALILGFSIIIKPVAIFFIWPLSILLFFFVFGSYKKRFLHVLSVLLFFWTPVLFYMGFNKINYGYFRIDPLVNASLFYYFLPRLIAKRDNIPVDVAKKTVNKLLSYNKDLGEASLKKESLMLIVLKNPLDSAYVWFQNVSKSFFGLVLSFLKVLLDPKLRGGYCSFFKTNGSIFERVKKYVTMGTDSKLLYAIGFLEILYLLFTYVLSAFALVVLFLRREKIIHFFTLYIMYFSMITGHDGCARFRIMFEFVIIILASYGLFIFLAVLNKKIKLKNIIKKQSANFGKI
ncbi:hypothetical protein HN511_00430 [bacterium]|nr:hypothetical protein [bacterium]